MNFYLLKLLGKWTCFLVVSLSNFLGINIDNTSYEIVDASTRNTSVEAEVIPYKVLTTYNSSLPSDTVNVKVTGQNGVVFKNPDGSVITLSEVIDEQVEVGTAKKGLYTGVITGYGPDCSTCNGMGIVACKTLDKSSFNLITDGIYYNDSQYGQVRVLAAALSEFPCGTIVKVNSKTLGQFMGIVLDTGYDMRKNLERGVYHFDVAYSTEKEEMVAKTTDMSGEVIYEVQRWGW